jgi:hypothetical protein
MAGLTTGTYTDTITVTAAGASNSPQSVAVTFTVQDFQMGMGSGGSTSATVAAGSSAVYNLAVNAMNGYSGSVSFACSGLPAASSCSFSPTQVNVSGTTAIPFTVTVTTTARSTTAGITASHPLFPKPDYKPMIALAFAVMLGALMLMSGLPSRQRRFALLAAMLIIAAFGLVACGSQTATTTGTPTGSYTVGVMASSGTLNHTMNLTLTVN